ncbi:MAG TPA: translocation/assembly module TamB domain-containing protein [Gemmatimonadales bacterium]|nr:translocation/assembly module TamB domain-containing protein [Gemmatimonadales bacterium]
MRRSLGVVLWTFVGILACFLGGLSALVGTGAGRKLLGRVAVTALQGAVSGTVEIGSVSGTVLTGLSLRDVRLYDEDTTLVAWLPRAEVDYNLLDFTAGRVVMQRVLLVRPYVNIVQHKNGRLNIEELLRLGGPPSPHPGPKQLVVLRNVSITDADLVLRLQSRPAPDDSLHEIDAFGTDGRRRVRRLRHLNTFLNAFRISAPGQRGLRLDFAGLAVEIDDPAVTLTDMRGTVGIDGDSLEADLPAVRLPDSRVGVKGKVSWPHDTLRYDLVIKAAEASLADVRFLDPKFPDGALLHGVIAIRSHGARVIEIRLDPLDLDYRGGTATGKLTAFMAADSGLAALRNTDVQAEDLDLSLFHAFIDSLPFHGHLSGHTTADGPATELVLGTDWAFRDSLAPRQPVSHVKGQGRVDLKAPVGITFLPFTVEAAALDFGTIEHFVPSPLLGTLGAQGTLAGPIKNFTFEGTLRHQDGDRPPSVLRGRFSANALGDEVALNIDAQVDTLSFDGLQPSFPALRLSGGVSGTVRLAGRLDSLDTHIDLSRLGGGGRIRANGGLVLLRDRNGTRNLAVAASDLSLDRWLPGAPPSALNVSGSATLMVDTSGQSASGQVEGTLRPSQIAGTDLDSGAVRLRIASGVVHVDTLWLRQPGLITDGAGTLGWRRPNGGETLLTLDADSLSFLDPLVAWISGTARDTARAVLDRGAAVAHLRVAGALDSLAIGFLGDMNGIAYGDWEVTKGTFRGQYEPGSHPLVWLDAHADSLEHGSMAFGAASGMVKGRLDSLNWSGRTRIGDLSGIVAGGRYHRDTIAGQVLGVDSLAVLLPHGVWYLTHPSRMQWHDATLVVDSLELQQVGGPGRFAADGRLPTAGGIGEAHLHVAGFPFAGVYALLQSDTLGAAGNVAADVMLRGSRRDPEYQGRFAVVPDSAGAPSLDGTFNYAARRLDAAASLKSDGHEVVGFSAHLPLDLALLPVARRQLPDTLAIRARADGADLSPVQAFTSTLRNVRGRLTADLGIRGTWDAPRLDGRLRIDSGGLDVPSLNVSWGRIAGRLRLGGDTIYVDTLGVESGERGRAELAGFVRLEQLSRPILSLDINASDFKALEVRGNVSVTASARLALRGPVFGATLTGQGTVTNGVLYFADLVEKRIIDLDSPDPELAGLIDTSLAAVIRRQGLGPTFHNVFLDSLGIRDLQLSMGSSVWLRSNEANIQLSGRMTVNKVNRAYRLTGTLLAPRGTYRMQVGPVTREFLVTSGTVNYFGTPDLDAGLDIEAEHVVHPVAVGQQANTVTSRCSPNGDVTVIAHIGGTLLVPRLTLNTKDCTMPQTDIISYLMFGQPSADIASGDQSTAAQARKALLVSTAASVAAGEIERSVVSDLGIPLDYVEIRPGDPDNPFVGATFAFGKQIGARTFFIVRARVCPGTTGNAVGASLQFRFSPEWRTEASVETVGQCSTSPTLNVLQRQVGADLFWERRY